MNGEDLFVAIDNLAGAGHETVAGRDILLEKQRHLYARFAEVEAERLSTEDTYCHAEVRAFSTADFQDTIRNILFYDERPVSREKDILKISHKY